MDVSLLLFLVSVISVALILWKLLPVTAVLTSSLGDREACLGEEVTFTCVVEAPVLIWNFGSDDNIIGKNI